MDQEHRLYARNLRAGTSEYRELTGTEGTSVDFEAALGEPVPSRVVAGRASLDLDLRWKVMELRRGDVSQSYSPAPEALIDVAGAPALYGLTARRLLADGIRPGQARAVEILRIGHDGEARTLAGRVIWLGGREWRLLARAEATSFAVRSDGAVANVQGTAELIERG